MSSLKHIKNRIKGITSTKKITQTMKIVSASRLRQFQANVISTREYLEMLNGLLLDVYNFDNSIFEKTESPYMQISKGQSTLFIVFGSDKGLCGSFNSKLISEAAIEIDSHKKQGKKIKVICVGDKIYQYMNIHYKDDIEFAIPFASQGSKSISYNNAVLLGQKIHSLFERSIFDQCKILYTKFNSVMNQEICNIQILPINSSYIMNIKQFSEKNEIFEFDDDLSIILVNVVFSLINITIFNAYANSITCECSARMLAMDNAMRNSEKILKELSLVYNRNRQALITKELIEVISGVEAIN